MLLNSANQCSKNLKIFLSKVELNLTMPVWMYYKVLYKLYEVNKVFVMFPLKFRTHCEAVAKSRVAEVYLSIRIFIKE